MKIIRLISQVFFYLTRFLSYLYFFSAAFCLIVLLLHQLFPAAAWVPIKTYALDYDTGSVPRFEILIPFTEKPIFLGRNTPWGMTEIVVGMGLYGLFFYLLSKVFDAFRQEKLFTEKAVKALMLFAKANFILPPLFVIFLYFHPGYQVEGGEISVMLLHNLLGVFALFQAAIFKEGFHLQKEQDLTI